MRTTQTGRRRAGPRTLRRITPAVLALVRNLQEQHAETVTITVTPAAATAIARTAARRTKTIGGRDRHPAHNAVRKPAQISLATAEQWRRDAWQAVRDGQLDVADAQALSDQLQPPGAA